MINEERSYTEYNVEVPTTDFPIGFNILDDGLDVVAVTLNDVDPTTLGYTVIQVNNTTYRFAPAVPSGVVRLMRITDIDQMAHVFTEGAIFISENMDGNFKQIRHAQQEVRDNFGVLQRDFSGLEGTVLPLVGGLEVALQAAEAAATAAGEAADIAVAVQTDIAQKFPNGKLKAVDVLNASTETQQQINDFGGAKWYAKSGGYELGAAVKLTNGDVVKSTVANNIIDPNVDMTGWFNWEESIRKRNLERLSVKDFGAILDGNEHKLSEKFSTLLVAQVVYPFATSLNDTLDYCAYQAAINYCATKGFNTRPTINDRTGRGGIVYVPSGQAVINKPLIMPRSGNFDGASVYIEGESTSSSAISATSTFPTGRAMIEWEDSALRIYWQGIKNIAFRLPNVEDTKAIWFKNSSACITGGSTTALIFAEYLHGFDLRNITVEATNTHHKNCIQFDGYVRVSKFIDLTSNLGIGGAANYNTVFLQFASSYGTSSSVLGESNGCAYSEINNIWGMGQRGGNGVLVKGRFLQSTGRNWTNGNGTTNATPAFEINNSFIFSLKNTGSEGRGEQPQYLVNNCIGVDLVNIGLGAPDELGCNGVEFRSCEGCSLDGRFVVSATPSFTRKSGKAVIIDANCNNVKVRNLYITADASTEVSILSTPDKNNSIHWVRASTKEQGTVYATGVTADKGIAILKRNATQSVPITSFTPILFQIANLDTLGMFISADSIYSVVKAGVWRISGGISIDNAELGKAYDIHISIDGVKGEKISSVVAVVSGSLFIPFDHVIRKTTPTLNKITIGLTNNGASNATVNQYATNSTLTFERLL